MTKDNQKSIKKQTQTEESVEALQAELERLRMENAYLKSSTNCEKLGLKSLVRMKNIALIKGK